MKDRELTYQDFEQQLKTCRQHRWRHGINARYYNESPQRLDLRKYAALAATIVGVYESAAEGSTSLQSKSLIRESQGAQLQRDIAAMAANALKNVFIKSLAKVKGNRQLRCLQLPVLNIFVIYVEVYNAYFIAQ